MQHITTYHNLIISLAFTLLSSCVADSSEPLPGRDVEPTHTHMENTTPGTQEEPPYPLSHVGPTDTGLLIDVLDAQIQSHQQRLQSQGDNPSWLEHQSIATAYIHRARYTQNWQDWDTANHHIEQAFTLAIEGSGPFLTRATLNFSLHKFPEAETDLDRALNKIIIQNQEKSDILSRKAELAFQRGELQRTHDLLTQAEQLHTSATIKVQQGNLAFKTGDLERARTLIDEAISLVDPDDTSLLAWVTLQRGVLELESGHIKEANAFFLKANIHFTGWFLIEEHLAETFAILGHHHTARTMYEDIISRVPAATFIEALAESCEALHDDTCANTQRQLAKNTYFKDLNDHPQSAYGHAMDFFLQQEDTTLMLDIAQKNYDLRPGFDPATKLAQAHIRAGQLAQAQPLIESALDAGWSTAELHATAATLYTLLKNKEKAEQQQSLAQSRNPESMADISWLVPVQ